MKENHRVLILHDLCTTGKAALTNMLPVLSVLEVEVCPLPTMLLSMPTGGKSAPKTCHISKQYIQDCVDQYIEEGMLFSAIFIGYLGNEEMVSAAKYLMQQFLDIPIFFDPIMGDAGRYYSNFDKAYKDSLFTLISSADILLPNVTELCLLSGEEYKSEQTKEELIAMCKKIGAQEAIITSVCMKSGVRGVALWQGERIEVIELTYETSEYHGTGDLFASVLLGKYVNGVTWTKSIACAHEFVRQCIQISKKMQVPKTQGLRIEKSLKNLYK